jgi:hypothetical protein
MPRDVRANVVLISQRQLTPGERSGYVYIDLQNATAPDYVRAARVCLAKHVSVPSGNSLQ